MKIIPVILIVFLLGVIFSAGCLTNPSESSLDTGKQLDASGKYNESLSIYDSIVEKDPGNTLAWTRRGLALQSLGRNPEAIESFDRALALDPNLALVWGYKGNSLHASGKYDSSSPLR